MNSKSNLITYLFVLAAGILLIIMHQKADLRKWMVIIMGAMFALPAIIGIFMNMSRSSKRNENNTAQNISSIGALILGAIMIIWPQPFVGFFVYVLAAILVITGACQIYFLAACCRPLIMPWWLYLLPALIIIAGIVIICSPLRTIETTFTLITGIALVCAAVNALLIYLGSNGPKEKVERVTIENE